MIFGMSKTKAIILGTIILGAAVVLTLSATGVLNLFPA